MKFSIIRKKVERKKVKKLFIFRVFIENQASKSAELYCRVITVSLLLLFVDVVTQVPIEEIKG